MNKRIVNDRTRNNLTPHMSFDQFLNTYGVYFTKRHTGKMKNMQSLSTCCLCNEYCKKQQSARPIGTKESICNGCFAVATARQYESAKNRWIDNTAALTSQVIPVEHWPRISKDIFRLESFGDLNNTIQVVNYFNLCNANPETTFTLWTKHPHLIKRVLDSGISKPDNLILIFSSFFVDHQARAPYDFIDKVFTVYRPTTAAALDIDINCGARNCNTCRRCYKKTGAVEYVNELYK